MEFCLGVEYMELDIEDFKYIFEETVYEFQAWQGTIYLNRLLATNLSTNKEQYIYNIEVLVDVGDEQGCLMPIDVSYTDNFQEAETVYDELVAHYNNTQVSQNEMWYE